MATFGHFKNAGFLRLICWTLCCWIASVSSAWAGQPSDSLIVNEHLPQTNLVPFLEYRAESGAMLNIRQTAALRDSEFSKYEHTTIAEGFTPDVWWFRFQLRNILNNPIDVVLETGNPFLDSVELFTFTEQGFKRRQLGDQPAFGMDDETLSNDAIRIRVQAKSEPVYYVRIITSTPLNAQLKVSSANTFMKNSSRQQWISGLTYGGLIGLLIFNLGLLSTVREGVFLSYVVYVTALLGTLAGVDGLLHAALPASGFLPTMLTFMLLNLSIGILSMLSCMYMGFSENGRVCRSIGMSLTGFNILAIHSFFFLPESDAVLFSLTVAMGTLAIVTLTAALRFRSIEPSRRMNIIASMVFNVAGVVVLLAFIGVLPDFAFALGAIKVTIAAKLGLLSLALGARINELKSDQARLSHQTEEAQGESKAFNQLLCNMGHAIRTPLNGVVGLTEVLGNTRMDREQRLALSGIQESGQSLLKLLNDAIDFSHIESGNLSLQLSNYDLEAVLNDCIRLTSHQARQNSVEIALCIRPNTPLELRGDPARLRQVMMYLLGNALEYTTSGSIVVDARSGHDKAGRPITQISVTDTGVGIPKDAHDAVFNPYANAGSGPGVENAHASLGLAIARKLLGMMNGTIGFHSVSHVGSTFWIEIPEKRSLVETFSRTSRGLGGNRKPAVLIVDRNTAYTDALRKDHVSLDINLRFASSIESAQQLLLRREGSGLGFDLILFDQTSLFARPLSESDLASLTAIREVTKTALMRSVDDVSARPYAKSFTFMVDKPHSGRQLTDVIQNVLIGEPAAHLDNWSNDEDVRQRLKGLKALVVDDNEVSTMVAAGFLQRMGIQHTDCASDGEDALARYRTGGTRYDVILMDCDMPVMDGYKATRAIREWEQNSQLPPTAIIAVSAHAQPEFIGKSLDAGMNDHLPKPVQYAELREKILALLPENAIDSSARSGKAA